MSVAGTQNQALELAPESLDRWYVARTQPHREIQAMRHLQNQSFRVFLPRYLKSRRHGRKFETVLAPLFPRYMFIMLDLNRERWRSVNGTLGVDRLLMRRGIPECVPHGLVEQLANAATEEGVVRCLQSLAAGETVRVVAGPFADFIGRLEQLDDHDRVRVLLDILGGKIPVTVPKNFVTSQTC
jgi:transcription elongation factor/antiterminator RfaH